MTAAMANTIALYLSRKSGGDFVPDAVDSDRVHFFARQMMRVAQRERLVDPNNAECVICDAGMARALGVLYFHTDHLEFLVSRRLGMATTFNDQTRAQYVREQELFAVEQIARENRTPVLSYHRHRERCVIDDPTQRFRLRESFRYVLSLAPTMRERKNQTDFSLSEIRDHLNSYVTSRPHLKPCPINRKMVVCKDDPLGVALGVNLYTEEQQPLLLEKMLLTSVEVTTQLPLVAGFVWSSAPQPVPQRLSRSVGVPPSAQRDPPTTDQLFNCAVEHHQQILQQQQQQQQQQQRPPWLGPLRPPSLRPPIPFPPPSGLLSQTAPCSVSAKTITPPSRKTPRLSDRTIVASAASAVKTTPIFLPVKTTAAQTDHTKQTVPHQKEIGLSSQTTIASVVGMTPTLPLMKTTLADDATPSTIPVVNESLSPSRQSENGDERRSN